MTKFGGWIRLDYAACETTEYRDLASLAAQLEERLERIRLRVEPGRSSSWTIDDAIKQVGWIDDECRIARQETEEFMEKYGHD